MFPNFDEYLNVEVMPNVCIEYVDVSRPFLLDGPSQVQWSILTSLFEEFQSELKREKANDT